MTPNELVHRRVDATQESHPHHVRVVERWLDFVNGEDGSRITEMWAPSGVVHPGGGLAEVRGADSLELLIKAFRVAFPDLHVTTEDVVADRDRVAARFTTRGTHLGPFMSIPPTGKRVEFAGFGLFRFAEGKIVEEWVLDDLLALMNQLSLPPGGGT
jgi:steroid delta-isomerase-like uncharacterized protein